MMVLVSLMDVQVFEKAFSTRDGKNAFAICLFQKSDLENSINRFSGSSTGINALAYHASLVLRYMINNIL